MIGVVGLKNAFAPPVVDAKLVGIERLSMLYFYIPMRLSFQSNLQNLNIERFLF
jgi:hypothetical protein